MNGTLGDNGWYTSNVSVSWSVVDNESAVTVKIGCDSQSVTSDTAGKTFTCQATSGGGTASKSVTIKRDATAPAMAPSVSPNPAPLDSAATANPGASDATSGIASATCTAAATGTVGTYSVFCTAKDKAGNVATASASYSVTDSTPTTSIRFLVPRAGATYRVRGAVRAKFRLVDPSERPIPDAAAQALVAACRVKLGLDSAGRCAHYRAEKDFFWLKVKIRRGTPLGLHHVVAVVRAPDGTMLDRATTDITVH